VPIKCIVRDPNLSARPPNRAQDKKDGLDAGVYKKPMKIIEHEGQETENRKSTAGRQGRL